MTAMSPIVVGTDGSPTAEQAVDKAAQMALSLGAEVHVVMSCSPASSAAWMASVGGVAIAADPGMLQLDRQAEQVIARACHRLRGMSIPAHGHVCHGEAADALLQVAADTEAQLIVVGNRGMHGARRVLGSVPNRVSHQANCCVLIVPTA